MTAYLYGVSTFSSKPGLKDKVGKEIDVEVKQTSLLLLIRNKALSVITEMECKSSSTAETSAGLISQHFEDIARLL